MRAILLPESVSIVKEKLYQPRGNVRSFASLRLIKQMRRIVLLAVALSLSLGIAAKAQLPVKKVLTLDAAKKIAAAAEAEAKKRGATVVIVVVDDGGHLLLLERLDDTQVASAEVGIGKARTAAIFRRPSKVFEDQVREGRVAALALPGATPLQGGVPVIFEGKVIGAIGVSGNTPQEDEDIAKVGAVSAAAAIAN
jgi:glc operon protein GlcG